MSVSTWWGYEDFKVLHLVQGFELLPICLGSLGRLPGYEEFASTGIYLGVHRGVLYFKEWVAI